MTCPTGLKRRGCVKRALCALPVHAIRILCCAKDVVCSVGGNDRGRSPRGGTVASKIADQICAAGLRCSGSLCCTNVSRITEWTPNRMVLRGPAMPSARGSELEQNGSLSDCASLANRSPTCCKTIRCTLQCIQQRDCDCRKHCEATPMVGRR